MIALKVCTSGNFSVYFRQLSDFSHFTTCESAGTPSHPAGHLRLGSGDAKRRAARSVDRTELELGQGALQGGARKLAVLNTEVKLAHVDLTQGTHFFFFAYLSKFRKQTDIP